MVEEAALICVDLRGVAGVKRIHSEERDTQ